MKNANANRRSFLKTTATGTAGIIAASMFPSIVPASVFGKNAPSNKINIGQIGFGRIASTHDLPEVLRNEVAHVMAVADVDKNRLAMGKKWIEKKYADKTGKANYVDVQMFDDYKELLARPACYGGGGCRKTRLHAEAYLAHHSGRPHDE